jgi:16S rRNA U516 pseudouridylate synthase RsuA-like enzyme
MDSNMSKKPKKGTMPASSWLIHMGLVSGRQKALKLILKGKVEFDGKVVETREFYEKPKNVKLGKVDPLDRNWATHMPRPYGIDFDKFIKNE